MLAVVVGLLLVLVPLMVLVGLGTEDHREPTGLLPQSFAELDGSGSQRSKSDTDFLEGLSLSFAIAVVGFMLVRRRRPESERRPMVGQWPY